MDTAAENPDAPREESPHNDWVWLDFLHRLEAEAAEAAERGAGELGGAQPDAAAPAGPS